MSQVSSAPSSLGLKALALIQTVCSLSSVLALLTIANVRGEMFLPTPTCPKWINPFNLSAQTKQLCGVESINLYEPAWAVSVFVISISASAICLLGALVLWRIKTRNNSAASDKHVLVYQIAVAGLALILCAAIFVFMPVIAGWIPGPTPQIFD